MSKIGPGRIIFSQDEIQLRISEVAAEINRDYEGQKLIIVSVLKGSIYFVADLTRCLTIPLKIDFLSTRVPSEASRKHTGGIQFVKDLDYDLQGQHVLLVEDVIGTGLTLGLVRQHLEAARPASLKVCTLLDTGWTMRKNTATCPISLNSGADNRNIKEGCHLHEVAQVYVTGSNYYGNDHHWHSYFGEAPEGNLQTMALGYAGHHHVGRSPDDGAVASQAGSQG